MSNTSAGGRPLEDVISKIHNLRADSSLLVNSLMQLRAVRTDPPNDHIADVTDVKLFRVAAWGTQGHVAAHFIGVPTGIGSTLGFSEMFNKTKTRFVFLYLSIVGTNYNVSYFLPKGGTTDLILFDIFGRRIFEQKINDAEGNHLVNLSAEALSSGTYFLRCESGTMSETKKFIVMH